MNILYQKNTVHPHMSTLSTASGTDSANIVVDIAIPDHTLANILFSLFFWKIL